MQRCNCTVRLNGDVNNTVTKTAVTPAEIALLLAIHGDGSVVDIKPTHQDKTPHQDERSRLSTIYGQHVLDRLFPGQFTKLPVSLSDISLGAPADEEGDAEEENAPDGKAEGDKTDADADADADKGKAEEGNGGEDEDDKILRERIASARSKDDLRAIAAENEVSLEGVADKMDVLRAAIVEGIFPASKG